MKAYEVYKTHYKVIKCLLIIEPFNNWSRWTLLLERCERYAAEHHSLQNNE